MDGPPFEQLVEQLHDDTDWLVRGIALRRLQRHGEQVLPYLDRIFQLTFDEHAPVLDAAKVLIRSLGSAAVPFLLDQMNSDSAKARAMSLRLLLECGNCYATTVRLSRQILEERTKGLPDWGRPPEQIFAHFRNALSDPDLEVRYAAACGLEEFGVDIPATIPVLIETVKGGTRYAQHWAALHLGRIGKPAIAACDALQTLTESENEYARHAAQNALARIRDSEESNLHSDPFEH